MAAGRYNFMVLVAQGAPVCTLTGTIVDHVLWIGKIFIS